MLECVVSVARVSVTHADSRCLEEEYLSADGRKVKECVLHGGKMKAGRAAWAKEMTYLHVEVDESGDYWAKLFKKNQDEDDRATIPNSPEEAEPPAVHSGVIVNARANDENVTESEHASLRQMVRN